MQRRESISVTSIAKYARDNGFKLDVDRPAMPQLFEWLKRRDDREYLSALGEKNDVQKAKLTMKLLEKRDES
jgi:hypothetical protein